jgi:chaperonin GroES
MLKPMEDKVVVKTIKEDKTTKSGFILTSLSEEKPQEAVVVAVGPGLMLGNGQMMIPDVSVGDKVLFSKYQGTEVSNDGEDYLILAYRDILAILN